MERKRSKKTTSWGGEALWYQDHLTKEDTYHNKVILPNVLRLIDPQKNMSVLEIGCGQGFFAHEITKKGARVTACDIAPELIDIAKKRCDTVSYVVSPAQNLAWVASGSVDVVLAVLTLQNMEKLDVVLKEVARVLAPTGRFIFVLNHPIIRVPQATSWGYDTDKNIQYRRVDAYLSGKKVAVDMHPGVKGKKSLTYSFHRSLQEYMKLLRGAGLVIVRLEEWISHKSSEPGPRAKAENEARKEFPLFMMIEASPFPHRLTQ